MQWKRSLLLGLGSMLFAARTDAILIDRGSGLIYDTQLNITWLAYGSRERMQWSDARDWVASIQYFDPIRSIYWTDWRLPAYTNGTWEMTYNYYVNLKNVGRFDEYGNENMWYGMLNKGPFTRIQATTGYWTRDPEWYKRVPVFFNGDGSQIRKSWWDQYYAWPVRDGDVGPAPPVPEPSTLALLFIGVIIVFACRLKKHDSE